MVEVHPLRILYISQQLLSHFRGVAASLQSGDYVALMRQMALAFAHMTPHHLQLALHAYRILHDVPLLGYNAGG